MDLASMLHARAHIFCGSDLVLHLRADASPQFGWDLFLVEVDHLQICPDTPPSWQALQESVYARVLPVQTIGLRAGSLPHKINLVNHVIALEASKPEDFCAGTLFSVVSTYALRVFHGELFSMVVACLCC